MSKAASSLRAVALLTLLVTASGAAAQSRPPATSADDRPDVFVLIGPGIELTPRFPGSKDHETGFFPAIEVWSEDEPFPAEAPDEGFARPLVRNAAGSAAGFTIGRSPGRSADSGFAPLNSAIDVGTYGEVYPVPSVRVRGQLAHGIGGHMAVHGNISIDGVVRTPDDRVVATIGPRVRMGSGSYRTAYFGSPQEPASDGLRLYGVGLMGGAHVRLSDQWGLYGYAGIDQIVGEAADGPVVRAGSATQYAGGLAVTYRFRIKR